MQRITYRPPKSIRTPVDSKAKSSASTPAENSVRGKPPAAPVVYQPPPIDEGTESGSEGENYLVKQILGQQAALGPPLAVGQKKRSLQYDTGVSD